MMNAKELKKAIEDNVKVLYRKTIDEASKEQVFYALSYAIKDTIIDEWIATHKAYDAQDAKILYYLSMEFLIGRALGNNIINLGARKEVAEVMEELGFSMTDIFSGEVKANGKVVKVAYLSTYEGYSIYAEPLYVVFKNGKIIGIEGKTAIGFPASKRQVSVISPEKALLIFMSEEGKTSQTTEIKSIELVFWVNNENVDEDELVLDTAFPAWRIIYGDSKVRYIEANRE